MGFKRKLVTKGRGRVRRPVYSYKRRRFNRRRRFNTRRNLVITGFPTKKMARLRYAQEVTINPATVAASYVFRANDVYDPDVTGTGHQPRGFDEWMNIYEKFTVVGSKIRIEPIAPHTADQAPSTWGILLSETGTVVSGSSLVAADMLELKYNKHHKAQYGEFNSVARHSLTSKFSAKRFFGKKDILGGSQFQGTSSTSPTEQAFYEIWAYGNATIDPAALWFRVIIDYIVVFTGPRQLPMS